MLSVDVLKFLIQMIKSFFMGKESFLLRCRSIFEVSSQSFVTSVNYILSLFRNIRNNYLWSWRLTNREYDWCKNGDEFNEKYAESHAKFEFKKFKI